MSVFARLRRAVGRFKCESGAMAVEFAFVAPVLIFFILLTVNFGFAYNMKLRLVTAAGAGIAYAQENGASVTSSNFASFADSIAKVVQSSADFGSAPVKVAVSINNTADGSAADQIYCVSGSPPVWSQMGAAPDCGNGVAGGKFVTLTLSTSVDSIFPTNGIIGTLIPLQETIIAKL